MPGGTIDSLIGVHKGHILDCKLHPTPGDGVRVGLDIGDGLIGVIDLDPANGATRVQLNRRRPLRVASPRDDEEAAPPGLVLMVGRVPDSLESDPGRNTQVSFDAECPSGKKDHSAPFLARPIKRFLDSPLCRPFSRRPSRRNPRN